MSRSRQRPVTRERRVAPGVVERHARECASVGARRACSCQPVYAARVRVGARGEQHPVAQTFATLAEAVAWRDEVKATMRQGGLVAPPRRPAPLLGQAAADFLRRALAGEALNRSGRPYSAATLGTYETALRLHVLPFVSERTGLALADMPSDAVDTRTLQAMVNHIAPRSAGMARQADAAIGAVLRDLYGRELLEAVPPRPSLPAPPKARDRALTPVEADRLLAAAEADDRARTTSLVGPLTALLVATGARISELLALAWGPDGLDLDADPPTVTIGRAATKTDAGVRRIGLEAEFAAVLRRHRLATGLPADGRPVFADERGEPLTRDGRVRSGLRRVAKAAGLEGIGFHVLRHSQGSWLSAAGEPATDIAARLGHSDPAFTLRRYVHADRARLAQPPAALARLREEARRTSGRGV